MCFGVSVEKLLFHSHNLKRFIINRKNPIRVKMLVEFRVENFRSIKKEVILSMVASEGKELESNLISNGSKESGLLRSAADTGSERIRKKQPSLCVKIF